MKDTMASLTRLLMGVLMAVLFLLSGVSSAQTVSSDGWALQNSSQGNDLRGVWGSSPTDVWAVGQGGTVLHYDGYKWGGTTFTDTDSGNTWSGTSFDPSVDLYGVWGSASRDPVSGLANDVYAVGSWATRSGISGTILHYDGTAWSVIWEAGSPYGGFYGVWGSSATDVFVVGGGGTIYHYDGTWSAYYAYVGYAYRDMYAVWGSSSTDVYAVGASGTLLHYDGTAWSLVWIMSPYEPYADVWGFSSSNVYLLGVDSDGFPYIEQYPALRLVYGYYGGYISRSWLYDLWGSSPTDVFAVGDGGFILYCDGTSCGSMDSGTSYALYGVWGSSSTDVFAVGAGGTILQYQPPTGQDNPVPTTTSVAPATTMVGTPGLSITVNGTNFIGKGAESYSVVLFNGAGMPTTRVSSTQLTAVIPAKDLASVGTFEIAVFNPAPSGGVSNSQNFTVSQGPSFLSVAPATGVYRGIVTLSATLRASGTLLGVGPGISGETIAFSLNGAAVGTASTDASGVATLSGVSLPAGLDAGSYPTYVLATFAGDSNYTGSTASGNLTVTPAPTTITFANVSAQYTAQYQNVTLTVGVTSPAGTVSGGYVHFTPSYELSGTASVVDGNATGSFNLSPMSPGTYVISASYSGSTNFVPSSGQGQLTVYQGHSDLRITYFRVPPALQVVDPKTIVMAAVVHNYGPDPAYNVLATISYYVPPPLGSGTEYVAYSNLGTIAADGQATLSGSYNWSGGLTFTAQATSTSLLPNPPQNVATLELDSLYFTDDTPPGSGVPDHVFRLDRDGYSFVMKGADDVNWGLFSDTFGDDNVYDSFTIPIIGTTVTYKDPLAELFYDGVWEPWFHPGTCYGFATTSLNFWMGAQHVQDFSAGASSVYTMQMQPLYNLYEATWRNILRYHGTELGYQVLNQEVSYFNVAPTVTLQQLKAQMMSYQDRNSYTSDPDILVMLDFATLAGHAVVPYRIVETPTSADIYVYDNSFPGDPTHAVNVNLQSNTWSYGSSQFSGSGTSGLFRVPRSVNDAKPILPYKRLGTLILDFVESISVGGSNANMQNTDSSGRSVGYQDGTFVEQIPGAMRIRPLAQSSPASSFPEAYLLPSAGEYTTTLSGTGAGPVTAGFLHDAAGLKFTSQSMTPTTKDTITFAPDGSTVTLGTNVAAEQYSTTLFQNLGASTREYTVGNTTMASGEKITQALINGGAFFEIVNQGNPKTYDLALQQVGLGAATTSFSGLAIGAGETHIFTVSDWTNLSTTEVDLQIKNSQGTVVTTEALQIPLTVRVAGDPAGGSVSPAIQTVLRGGTATFEVVTNSCYSASVSEGTLSGNVWTIPNVTAPHAVTVTFTRNPPPAITGVSANPQIIWPPNKNMVDVTISYGITDRYGQPTCQITSITSNEPISASDYVIVDAHHVRLRADRLGNGSGRAYKISITCADSCSTSSRTVTVMVPHDQGK